MRTPFIMRWLLIAVCCVSLSCVSAVVARADEFVLQNGGRVSGEWLNADDNPLQHYRVRTEQGGLLLLAAAQVRQVIHATETADEYQDRLVRCEDAVAGHWQLAEWCREKGLRTQRSGHLRRILELEPDHPGARRGLGFSQLGGQWVTREGILRQRGYQRYDGRWMLPQEAELIEADRDSERVSRDWLLRLRRWREMIGAGEIATAQGNILGISDPRAVSALSQVLSEEPQRNVKLLYIEALTQIGDPAALGVLLRTTLQDPDEEIFHACLERLLQRKPPGIVKRYLAVLKDDNNVRLNRAAYALGQLGEPTAISPLIDVLITTHYIVIPKKSDAYTTTFAEATAPSVGSASSSSPFSGTSFTAGDETKVIPKTVPNQEALQALIKLSGGVNFGFDQRAWRFWLAGQGQPEATQVQGRRDRG